MKLRKRILTGIGALAFMALVVLNVQLIHKRSIDQSVSGISLVELAAQAQGQGESNCTANDPGECSASATACNVCCVGNSPNCEASEYWVDCGYGRDTCEP